MAPGLPGSRHVRDAAAGEEESAMTALSIRCAGARRVIGAVALESLKGKAKAPKGTSPRSDGDKWTIQCQPRTGACPGSASGAFVDEGRSVSFRME
jgi:hypothetical protein